MPTLSSRHFGPVEYQSDAVLEFPAGLPGFEQERSFVPIEHASSKPIVFLQSLTRPELCFITLPVRVVQPDYGLAIPAEDLRTLGLAEARQPEIGAEVLCLAIVSVAEGKLPTANLLAPIVVNLRTRRGVQAIQEDSAYSHQHPLLAMEREEACS
jgi:flagellar assembly factor FliW